MPVVRATDDDLLQLRPDEGRDGHDVGRDLGGPETFLIPRQQVASEREAEHEKQQHHAKEVVNFARSLVRAVDDHLHQVQHEQDRHGLGRVVMDAAQEPAAPHLALDVVHALPGRLRTGRVGHPEKNPGDDLHHEGEAERAAPHVTPARAARHVFVKRLVEQFLAARAAVHPIVKRLDFVHAGIFSDTPARKFWNFTHTSESWRISTSSSSSPRGEGLFGSLILPSRANVLLWQGQR